MMPPSAQAYAERVRAARVQRQALSAAGLADDPWGFNADKFRDDPRREPNETLRALLSYIEPADVVLDVGGGAGRYLPLALHCRTLINVEPSTEMGARFEACARDAGIDNAHWLHSAWLEAEAVGDVVFTASVLYYIDDVIPFIEKLVNAARRRVMIVMHSLPPTNHGAERFRCVHGHEPALAPGFRELLPVLWDMGILPDVRVLGPSEFIVERERFASRAEAISAVLRSARLEEAEQEGARRRLEAQFDHLFSATGEVYIRRPAGTSRVMLITWTSAGV